MSIGQKIKEFRKGAHLTQEALAYKANISRPYLGDIERDRYNPSIETLRALASALAVDVSVFLSDGVKSTDDSEETNKLVLSQNKFRALRVQHSLSQQELADILKVDRTIVGRWERGDTIPAISTLFKLCDLYSTSIDYILGRSPSARSEIDIARQRIVELLDEFGTPGENIMKRFGYKKSDLDAWRNGKSSSFMSHLEEIANSFDVSVPYLLGKTLIRNTPMTADGGPKIEGLDELLTLYRDLSPRKKRKLIERARMEAMGQKEQDSKNNK